MVGKYEYWVRCDVFHPAPDEYSYNWTDFEYIKLGGLSSFSVDNLPEGTFGYRFLRAKKGTFQGNKILQNNYAGVELIGPTTFIGSKMPIELARKITRNPKSMGYHPRLLQCNENLERTREDTAIETCFGNLIVPLDEWSDVVNP